MSDAANTTSVRLVNDQIRQHIPAGLYISTLVAFLSIWHWKATGHLSWTTVATFAAFSSAALIYGRLVLRFSPLPPKLAGRLTLEFLFGFLCFNTSLFVLSLAFRFGIGNCFLILVAIPLVAIFVRDVRSTIGSEAPSQLPDLLCLLIAGVGATLWCSDALSPIVIEGQKTVFKIWQDSFAHIRMISAFAQAHGLREVSDFRMAGVAPFPYHYASYFTPAAVESLTGTNAFDVFVGFFLPLGILLTGLAAFALAASLQGPWPGLAASCAIILLPDSYEQGFSNRYLSYNFLQQVNLAGLYGVSAAAAAWIFILHGCRSRKYNSIIIGYTLTLITLACKSQVFVANAFLAMIYPCLFFIGLRASRRCLLATAFVALFVVMVRFSQGVEGVPTLSPDFSFHSASAYAGTILESYDPGFFKSFFSWLILPGHRRVIVGLSAAVMILLSRVGLWSVAFGVMFLHFR